MLFGVEGLSFGFEGSGFSDKVLGFIGFRVYRLYRV